VYEKPIHLQTVSHSADKIVYPHILPYTLPFGDPASSLMLLFGFFLRDTFCRTGAKSFMAEICSVPDSAPALKTEGLFNGS
jgi:hypothetical protein